MASLSGCGQKFTPGGSAHDVTEINTLIAELDSDNPGRQRKAMVWIRRMKPRDAEPASARLQELTQSDDELVKKDAQETLAHIQGS